MDYSSPLLMQARNFGRKLGVLRPVQVFLRNLRGEAYEENFERALLAGIEPGDVVWDVGANIGFYTGKFAGLVGDTSKVVAFEPGPETFDTISANMKAHANVVCQPIALSDFEGEANFHVANEANSPVSGLAQRKDIPVAEVKVVKVTTGDAFVAANPQLSPTKMKIDVEGFEYEVLKGMPKTLSAPTLRTLFIEIHFGSLAERGLADAPREMTEMLKNGGFSLRWTDASHIVATRKS